MRALPSSLVRLSLALTLSVLAPGCGTETSGTSDAGTGDAATDLDGNVDAGAPRDATGGDDAASADGGPSTDASPTVDAASTDDASIAEDAALAADAATVTDAATATDAATVTDAGLDASTSDASVPSDAGLDAAPSDAATPADAGVDAAGVDAALVDAAMASDASTVCAPRTFVVTTPGFAYSFDGGPSNPVLTLCRGVTYTFNMTAVPSIHPIELVSGAASLTVIPAGVTTTYTVPATAPLPTAYRCQLHFFGSSIVTL